jgi:uncharacterized membrane protein
MSERRLRLAGVALAAVGAAIAGYLLYARESGGALVCATGGCETVQRSAYADVLGVPVAAVGLAGFLTLMGAAVARGEWARLTHATLALAALLFSAYLLVVQLAVVGAVCQWCVASDLVTTALAVVALQRLRTVAAPAPVPAAAPPYPRRRPGGGGAQRHPRRPARRR